MGLRMFCGLVMWKPRTQILGCLLSKSVALGGQGIECVPFEQQQVSSARYGQALPHYEERHHAAPLSGLLA